MLNQVQLIGYTGADAEIRTTSGGKAVANVRVCTSTFSKVDGEWREYPTWHQVEIWAPAAIKRLTEKPLAKGAKVFVQGEIRHDRFTDGEGVERFFSKVVVARPGQVLRALDRREPEAAEEA
jgi:single-strand DNA-binding protein